ncbi:hypothetical protein BOTBODRAFT_373601 [Botryobasidium botryosum FD-172 SS1]|uniref:Uncharacterized protein n=1 Tax=Botryobasidium botryosum (strain FD-172 SS1) TaxID=930990 RepID=A0A067MND7_BOTB1|nr:hypothetical protein BOTBODRAFT_373601 [Botryobasidium botryosum FD-172 SS1]
MAEGARLELHECKLGFEIPQDFYMSYPLVCVLLLFLPNLFFFCAELLSCLPHRRHHIHASPLQFFFQSYIPLIPPPFCLLSVPPTHHTPRPHTHPSVPSGNTTLFSKAYALLASPCFPLTFFWLCLSPSLASLSSLTFSFSRGLVLSFCPPSILATPHPFQTHHVN